MDIPIAEDIEEAVREVTGDSLLLIPTMGDSLPLYVLSDPFIIFPTVNHDNNQHSPNESLRIANLWYAIEVFARLITMG
jgi:acetylornithine deacetylase/succinyl-diaminopimelate desuccinylase-like protein